MGFMDLGRAWRAQMRAEHNARVITYRRPSTGQVVTGITVSVGQTQLVNVNSMTMEPTAKDVSILNAEATNRDYIAEVADLDDFWPPQAGDLIDDANDSEDVIKRYQLMALPGQNPWRFFQGGFQAQARLHTKFVGVYTPLWLDEFTDADEVELEDHEPDFPAEVGYTGGLGSLIIDTNRIIAGDALAFRYFDVGEEDITAHINFNINLTTMQLTDVYAEMGLGVCCAGSGDDLRDGYYCTLKVGVEAGLQTTRQLRIVKALTGVETEVAAIDLPEALVLNETAQLRVRVQADRITLALTDTSGEVLAASVACEPDAFGSNTTCAVIFKHHEDLDIEFPWMDHLEVEL